MPKEMEVTEILSRIMEQGQSNHSCWTSVPLLYADLLAKVADRLNDQEFDGFIELGARVLAACKAGLVHQQEHAEASAMHAEGDEAGIKSS